MGEMYDELKEKLGWGALQDMIGEAKRSLSEFAEAQGSDLRNEFFLYGLEMAKEGKDPIRGLNNMTGDELAVLWVAGYRPRSKPSVPPQTEFFDVDLDQVHMDEAED